MSDLKIIAIIEAQNKQFNAALEASKKKVEKLEKSLDTLKGKAKPTGDATKGLTSNLFNLGKAFIGLQVVKKVGTFLLESTQLFFEQERNVAALESALKSTNYQLGISSQALQDQASAFQEVTLFGDEATIGAQALLVTFKNIGKDVFPAATEAVLNISQAMGIDLKASAIQVGKALNDPIAGLTALSRNGITFTDSQKEVIKYLTETGEAAKAQKIILTELNSQFGGAAVAAADAAGGSWKQLLNTWGDSKEAIGGMVAGISGPLADALKGLIYLTNETVKLFDDLFDVTRNKNLKVSSAELTKSLLNNKTTLEDLKGTIPDEQLFALALAMGKSTEEAVDLAGAVTFTDKAFKASADGAEKAVNAWENNILKQAGFLRELKKNGKEAGKTWADLKAIIDKTRNSDGTANIERANAELITTLAEEKIAVDNIAKAEKKRKDEALKANKKIIDAYNKEVNALKKTLGITTETKKSLDKKTKLFLDLYKKESDAIKGNQEKLKKTQDYVNWLKDRYIELGKEAPDSIGDVNDELILSQSAIDVVIKKTKDWKKVLDDAAKASNTVGAFQGGDKLETKDDLVRAAGGDPLGDSLTAGDKWMEGIDYARDFTDTLQDLGVISEGTAETIMEVADAGEGLAKILTGKDVIGGAIQLAGALAKLGEKLGLWKSAKTGSEWFESMARKLVDAEHITQKASDTMGKYSDQIGEAAESFYSLREETDKSLTSTDKWELALLATVSTLSEVISSTDTTKDNFEDMAQTAVKTFAALENSANDAEKAVALKALNANIISLLDKADDLDMFSGSLRTMFIETERGGYKATAAMKKLKEEMFEAGAEYTEAQKVFHTLNIQELKDINKLQETLTKNQDMIDAIGQANEALTLLGNTNKLNTDSFAQFDKQVMDAFGGLVAGGLTEQQALEQMIPELENMVAIADEYGFSLSEGTQWLVNMGKEAGLLGEEQERTLTAAEKQEALQQAQLDLWESIAKALGADIPDSIKKFRESLEDVNKVAKDVRDNAENTRYPDAPSWGDYDGDRGTAPEEGGVPGFASGTNGFRAISSMPSDFIVGENGSEPVSIRGGMIKIDPASMRDDNQQGMKTYNIGVSFPNVNNNSNAGDLVNAINNNDYIINTLADKLSQNALLNR